MARLVSVAGGGSLGVELDLAAVADDIEAEVKRYEPETYPALYLKFKTGGATVMLFSSGKCNIAGAGSIADLNETFNRVVGEISRLLDQDVQPEGGCELRNMVYVDDYRDKIQFEPLIEELGAQNTEYEPESFPSLDYRPPDSRGLFKIFSSGKLTLTGTTDPESVEAAFEDLKRRIENSQ